MKKEIIESSQERKILIYMIVSTEFLKSIITVINSKLLRNSYSKILCDWILDYYEIYKESPGKYIQDIYATKYKSIRNEEDLELLSEFLSSLSKEYEDFIDIGNIQVIINNSINYLKIRSLVLIQEQLELAINKNDPLFGENAILNYNQIGLLKSNCVSILSDTPAIMQAFSEEFDIMLEFKGVLGEVCGVFLRGDLVSFIAPMKRGKTWWLIYTAVMAMYAGLHVLFVSLEMNQNQIIRRIWRFLKGQSKKDKEIEISYFFENDEEKFVVKKKKKKIKGVNIKDISKTQKKLKMMFKSGNIKILSLPAYNATLRDIDNNLDNLYLYSNFYPSVIIIDYADIIKPDGRAERMDYRHQLDYIWKSLRGMAQKRNSLIVTATQSSKAAFTRDITEEMVTEDIRKLAHVSKMIAINQNKDDFENNAIRISQLAEREEGRNYRQAYVLQCLDIGNPCIDSRYYDQVVINKNNKKKNSGKKGIL